MARIIFLLGLVAVWLDMALEGWWPAWLVPIWLWLGLMITIYRKDMTSRWLWLLSVAAWSIFTADVWTVLSQLVIFFLAGEAVNFIYNRYIPATNIFLQCIAGLGVLGVAQVLFMAATRQIIGWDVAGRVILTTILAIIFGMNYVVWKKTSKKQYL